MIEMNRLVEKFPDRPEVYFRRGQINRITGEFTDAILDLTETLKLNPRNKHVYIERGYAYRERIDYVRASKDFDSAIALDPGKAEECYRSKGIMHFDQQNYELAIEDYSNSLRLQPRHSMDLLQRGRCYSHLGQSQKAIADFNLAIKHEPGMIPAYRARAFDYYRLKDYRKSIADVDKFLELVKFDAHEFNVDNANVLDLRARCYFEMGEYKKSIDSYNQSLMIKPGSLTARAERTRALKKLRESKNIKTEPGMSAVNH